MAERRGVKKDISSCRGPSPGPSAPLPGKSRPLAQFSGSDPSGPERTLPPLRERANLPPTPPRPAPPHRAPLLDPLTLRRRGAAARPTSPGSARRMSAALRVLAPRRRPILPSPTPYNLITRDIKLSSRSLIIVRVTGTQHASASFDSPDQFAGSESVWVWGTRGGVEPLEKYYEPHAGCRGLLPGKKV